MPESTLPQESLPSGSDAGGEKADVSLKEYEGMFILKPGIEGGGKTEALSAIEGEISRLGGVVREREEWGKRRLGYRIKKENEGIYYRLVFTINPASVSPLKRRYRLNELILKVLFLRPEKRS